MLAGPSPPENWVAIAPSKAYGQHGWHRVYPGFRWRGGHGSGSLRARFLRRTASAARRLHLSSRMMLQTTDSGASRIGFGTAGLTSLGDRRAAIRLLDSAFDVGIRHFDTARLYGLGHAESIVGEFLKGKRQSVTLATKFGLEPPSGIASNPRLIGLAKRTLRKIPFIANRARRHVNTMVKASSFTPEAARRSLEKSLAELRTDYVDLFLLHECTLADSQDRSLLEFLEEQISRGTVRELGIATDARNLPRDLGAIPAAYRTVQLQESVLDPWLSSLEGGAGRRMITHSALKPLRSLATAAAARPEDTERWSKRVGLDLRDTENLAPMLLAYALDANPFGTVLFATTRPERIATNLRRAGDFKAVQVFVGFAREVTGSVESAAPRA